MAGVLVVLAFVVFSTEGEFLGGAYKSGPVGMLRVLCFPCFD